LSVLSRLFSRWSRRGRELRERERRYNEVLPLVERAVRRTGLIKSEYIPAIAAMMAGSPDARSEGVALVNRKSGTQLSAEEKKALGLRRNAFFSREVEAMLTDAGRANPLGALPVTMHHVTNAQAARRDIANAHAAGITKYRWRSSRDPDTCKFCRGRNGKLFVFPASLDDIDGFPGSCVGCTDDLCRCYAEAVVPGFTK
jgi:hypothetical protein